MMNPIVKELIVLQVIYALIVPQVQEVDVKDISSHNSGSGSSNNSMGNDSDGGIHSGSNGSSHSGSISDSPFIYSSTMENKVISSNIKLSLVKITNEIQNSLLVNELMDINHEAKLTIKDILGVIKDLFPLQRTILIDGQLSFHNLKIKDLKNLIVVKYDEFKEDQIKMINEYDTQLLQLIPPNLKHPSISAAGKRGSSAGSSAGSTRSTTPGPLSTSPGTTTTAMNTSTPTGTNSTAQTAGTTSGTVINKDPKREKLLQLYRDTVLNKLQSKTKILDRLYMNLNPKESDKVVYHLLELEKIKTTTPASVHNLQFILQKSASDGIMSSRTGSLTWQIARQVQTELDDTVQFMRRALE
ncbi:chromatin modification-related protein Eaf5p [Monosporozyma unispora]|nr:hypothetical protein C6P44_001381 [Kazachstania unispora]